MTLYYPVPGESAIALQERPVLSKSDIQSRLIKQGVRNLRQFGYPNCTEQNILTDDIYKAFFANMLRENRGQVAAADPAIDELLEQVS